MVWVGFLILVCLTILGLWLWNATTSIYVSVDEKRLCKKGHVWEQMPFITHKAFSEIEFLVDEEVRTERLRTLPKKTVCTECGFIAGEDKMLSERALKLFQHATFELYAQRQVKEVMKKFKEKRELNEKD